MEQGEGMNFKDRIFSEKEVNTGRQVEMDIAKVVFVLFVAVVHCTIDCVPEEALSNGLPYFFDSVIGGPMIAPGLMFSMGACLVYGRKKEWNDIVRRGVQILLLGFLLNLCRYTIPDLIGYTISGDREMFLSSILYQTFNNDIFQFAGLALITIGIFVRLGLSDAGMLVIAFLCSIAGTLLNGIDTGNAATNIILGYFIGIEDQAGQVMSYFVYLNWLIMPVSGYVFGKRLLRMKDKVLFYRIASISCFLATLPYFLIKIGNRQGMFGEGELCYYHIGTPDVLSCITTAVTMFGIYYFIGRHLSEKATKLVFRIGTDMTAFYFIHWIFVALIVQLFLNLVRGTQLLPMPWILFLAVVITAVSLILADIWKQKIRKGFQKGKDRT